MESPIVTLTTDWGYRDYFTGMVKGRLYSTIPNVRVVDITHGLEPFQLSGAIIVARHACMGFPAGTIHIIDISAPRCSNDRFVVVEHGQQYYICIDNGLPSALFGEDASHAVVVADVGLREGFHTFAAYDVFCPVAAMLAAGAELADVGEPAESFWRYTPSQAVMMKDLLKAYVAYVDEYGNALLNITYEEFEEIRAGRDFRMQVHEVTLTEVVKSYAANLETSNGRPSLLLTVSATGYLQVAMPQNSAEQFFRLRVKESVNVQFIPKIAM